MDAQRHLSWLLGLLAVCCMGANYRSQNFIVTARTPELAQLVGETAEAYRESLATEWLGRPLAPWSQPCPIMVQDDPNAGASGVTRFSFLGREPGNWEMVVQGTRERILDSVLPHEISHTVFATHFGCPLPRWADEGACTVVEHISERSKQSHLLLEFLSTGRGISFSRMFAMKQYPPDMLPLYSQGYSLTRFLIQQGGKQKFVKFVGDGMNLNNWTAATKQHYGYNSLKELQDTWLNWVKKGSPDVSQPIQLEEIAALAANAPAEQAGVATETATAVPVAAEAASPTAANPPNDAQLALEPLASRETPAGNASEAASAREAAPSPRAAGPFLPGSTGRETAIWLASFTPKAVDSNTSVASSQPGYEELVRATRPQPVGRPEQRVHSELAR